MSTRALRKLEESNKAQKPIKKSEEDEEDEAEGVEPASPNLEVKKGNIFDLLNEDEGQDDGDTASSNEKEQIPSPVSKSESSKKKRKKNKKKGKRGGGGGEEKEKESSEFDEILEEFKEKDAQTFKIPSAEHNGAETSAPLFLSERDLFRVEYRNLNPDTEMKRIFGSKVVDPELRRVIKSAERRAPRNRNQPAGGKIVFPKTNWNPLTGTGLSMRLVDSLPGGVNVFAFSHNQSYQEAQKVFWEAVESMDPDAFIAILQQYPYHIDTLLQLSEVMRTNDDVGGARDLVERALFAMEAAFHPLFNITRYNSRLEYRQRENRAFFLALFRHMTFLYRRGCSRTALEFSKLIYSLNPDQDPLGMMLMIDFLAIKARQYDYLLEMFRGLEAGKNLSLLPNFSFSVALGMFMKSIEEEENAEENAQLANEFIQEALIKFPTMLTPILDKCNVQPDKEVTDCPLFSLEEQVKDCTGLKQLISLYAARTEELWKEREVIHWLEKNVKELISRLPKGKNAKHSTVEEYRHIRRTRYQGTPRNILRHLVISELKDALISLPPDLRDTPILSYDPLPPPDSTAGYNRPETGRRPLNQSFLSGLLRSLMPNYDPDAAAIQQAVNADLDGEEEGAVGGAGAEGGGGGAAGEMRASVRQVLNAMRDLLNNVQVPGPEREDGENHNDFRDEDEWD